MTFTESRKRCRHGTLRELIRFSDGHENSTQEDPVSALSASRGMDRTIREEIQLKEDMIHQLQDQLVDAGNQVRLQRVDAENLKAHLGREQWLLFNERQQREAERANHQRIVAQKQRHIHEKDGCLQRMRSTLMEEARKVGKNLKQRHRSKPTLIPHNHLSAFPSKSSSEEVTHHRNSSAVLSSSNVPQPETPSDTDLNEPSQIHAPLPVATMDVQNLISSTMDTESIEKADLTCQDIVYNRSQATGRGEVRDGLRWCLTGHLRPESDFIPALRKDGTPRRNGKPTLRCTQCRNGSFK